MNQPQTEKKTQRKRFTITLISIIVVVLYPCLFMYFLNADKVVFRDILGPIGLFLLNAFIVYAVAVIILRDAPKAGVITNITMLFILLFSFIEKAFISIFPMLYYWHVVMLLFTIIVLLIIFLKKKVSTAVAFNINTILLVIFSVLIVFNGVNAAPAIIKEIKEASAETDEQIQIGTTEASSNVYYFIFDEYGGLANLERYCGYDNTPFYNELEELGFNVSKNSRNYTFKTNLEIPNLLNLERVLKDENYSNSAKIEAMENPYLFRLFKENGYQLNLISDQAFIPTDSTEIDYLYKPASGVNKFETIQTLIINNSVYYPFQMKPADNRISEINEVFQYAQESANIQSEKLFTFGYFATPHLPWVVDENGNSINGTDRTNWQNTDVYLGQLKYTSKKIIDTVQVIIASDPDAIIILQSDHGYRLPTHLQAWYDKPIADVELETKYQCNILNAVYYQGEKVDIESSTGINTLITVVDKHFGLNIKLIEPAE